jgi:predicted dienelactone hydrolase
MQTYRLIAAFLAMGLSVLAAANSSVAPAQPATGPLAVSTARFDWKDARRDRVVPVKIYFPTNSTGPFPLILFSHGLGGTRDGYEYLGRYWASHGYVSLHLQHLGSDDAAWRGQGLNGLKTMSQAASDPANAINRPLDVRFALDQALKLNEEPGPFHGLIATNRIGMAGHSFGAYTTLTVAGEVFGPTERGLPDERVKAAIAMSSPVPKQNQDRAFSKIKIPILHLTGTADNSPIGGTTPAERRLPFDKINGADQFLVTFNGGDHMVFSGAGGLRRDQTKDAAFHELILRSTTAFWNAYLKDDLKAKEWLAGGGCEKALGQNGVFEKKNVPSSN